MAFKNGDLVPQLARILDKSKIAVRTRDPLKIGAATSVFAVCGALLLGTIGSGIGAFVGGLTGFIFFKKSKPIAQLIRTDLTKKQKERLENKVVEALRPLHSSASSPQDQRIVAKSDFVRLLMFNYKAQDVAVSTTIRFIESDLKLAMRKI